MRHFTTTGVALLGLVTVLAAQPTPELLLTNGRVYTLDAARPWAEAIAIRGDRIVAVGSAQETRAAVGQGRRSWTSVVASRCRASTMRTSTSRARVHCCSA